MDDARAAVMGGLVFGAGGGGLDAGIRMAETVLSLGRPVLATLDELDDDDQVLITTGVGAPGVHRQGVWPKDTVRAMQLLLERWDGKPVKGTMTAHPGAWVAGGWLPSALDPNVVVVDCAANGRGHPTVKMGGMGLAGRSDVTMLQAAAGGDEDEGAYLEVVASGTVFHTSNVLRQASREAGGAIAACRGPLSVGFCKQAGAVGALSACMDLGAAMLGAEGKGGDAMIAAIVGTLDGRELGRGPLSHHEAQMEGAFDVGGLVVDAAEGRLEVSICNEYMSADLDGERLSTYPDLIVTLSPHDGMPTAAARMSVGDEIVVVAVPKANIPLGAGVWDATVYPEVERMTGKELLRYALEGAPR